MTEIAVVHYRKFRHISQVCRINYHGQSYRRQRTNAEEIKKNDPLPLPTVVTISLNTVKYVRKIRIEITFSITLDKNERFDTGLYFFMYRNRQLKDGLEYTLRLTFCVGTGHIFT